MFVHVFGAKEIAGATQDLQVIWTRKESGQQVAKVMDKESLPDC